MRLVARQHAPDGLAQIDGPGRLRLPGVGKHLAQVAVGRMEHVEHTRELAREQGVVLVREEQQLHGALAREHLLDRGVVQPLHHALLLDGAPNLDAVVELAIESHTAWYAPATSPATTADSSLKWSLSDMPKANVPTTRSPVREERTGTLRK